MRILFARMLISRSAAVNVGVRALLGLGWLVP